MNPSILIIGTVWPEPRSSAAGTRILQLIKLFLEHGYRVHFASASTPSSNAFNLREIGVNEIKIKLNDSAFDVFIKDLNPTMVLFDRFMTEEQYGWRVAHCCPKAVRILDTEDLHFLRKAREQAFQDNTDVNDSYLFNDVAKREMASIFRCDLSLIISQFELSLLKNTFNVDQALLHYLPFFYDASKIDQKALPQFAERQNFVSIGNFLHAPNVDAIAYLKEVIWPIIHNRLPEIEMHIYGAYTTNKGLSLNDPENGFFIKGFASDVNDIMKTARVCLAPLRFGAGLKGKLFDAMLNGTPCVTTNIGAEGIFEDMEPNGFIENDNTLIAEKAILLHTNKALWHKKQQNGFEVIKQRFASSLFEDEFIIKMKNLVLEIDERRHSNFIGQMLHYHTLQSTKYLSKWIEEKNKKTT